MDPKELLLERINRAEAAMEKAQADMEEAKEALGKWKQENPGYSRTNEDYKDLKEELDKCYNALKDNKEIYKELVKTYQKLIEKITSSDGVTAAEVPDIVLAIRDLTFEIRDNNKFLKNATKDKFTLLKPKSYKSDNHDIRLQWLIHYGMVSSTSNELPDVAHCHLLGAKVPMMYLNCSHLFQKRWHRHVRDFGLPSINSGKNILILLKIFEEAFDAGRFVLLFDKQTGLIRCKIIDNELKNKNLNEAMKDVFPNYTIGGVDFNGKTCFGDFDGEELHFLNAERPYTRCLSFHALVAREHAIDYGWIGETDLKELDDDDMWSDGFLDEKTRKFIDEWRVDVCSQLS